MLGTELEALPDALHFLAPYLDRSPERYVAADWLKSGFGDDKWLIELVGTFEIDWDVQVGSTGGSLLSPQHEQLLRFFRMWLVVQTHPDATGYVLYTKRSAYNKLRRTISLIDLILLNSDELGVSTHGPAALNDEAWRALLQRIAASCRSSESVYGWSGRLRELLLEWLGLEDPKELSRIRQQHPILNWPAPHKDEWLLPVTDDELADLRAMLWRRGLYRPAKGVDFLWEPNLRDATALIYRNTLAGTASLLPMVRELCLGQSESVAREYKACPVTVDTSLRRSKQDLTQLLGCIDHIGLLATTCSVASVHANSLEQLIPFLELKEPQRFRSIPVEEGFVAVRRAADLFYELGEPLMHAYSSLAHAAAADGITIPQVVRSKGIEYFLPSKLASLGVRTWSIPSRASGSDRASYFRQVRGNEGLLQLLNVVNGGIQIVVGALLARRVDELRKLRSHNALDADGTRLVFEAGKQNAGEHRERVARPIPPLAAQMVNYVRQLHLISASAFGGPDTDIRLFARLLPKGAFATGPLRRTGFYRCSDAFCDYIEVGRDAGGRRFYFRQHQLRRWFAMLFFWANSFGGAETLRWFLAHTDMQHLYHYVTDSVPGAVLRSAAASWATAAILAERPETKSLAERVGDYFGTRDFRIVSRDRVEMHVEQLLDDGSVTVEPLFFDFGRRCEIGVRLSRKAHE